MQFIATASVWFVLFLMQQGVFYDVEVLWEGVTVARLLECCATRFDLILDFIVYGITSVVFYWR